MSIQAADQSQQGSTCLWTSSWTVSRTHSLGCHPHAHDGRPGLLRITQGNMREHLEPWQPTQPTGLFGTGSGVISEYTFFLAESGRRILPLPLEHLRASRRKGMAFRCIPGRRWCVEERHRRKKKSADYYFCSFHCASYSEHSRGPYGMMSRVSPCLFWT